MWEPQKNPTGCESPKISSIATSCNGSTIFMSSDSFISPQNVPPYRKIRSLIYYPLKLIQRKDKVYASSLNVYYEITVFNAQKV